MLTDDLIAALLAAVDGKLAAADDLTLEDLELTQRLIQARIVLEALSARQARRLQRRPRRSLRAAQPRSRRPAPARNRMEESFG